MSQLGGYYGFGRDYSYRGPYDPAQMAPGNARGYSAPFEGGYSPAGESKGGNYYGMESGYGYYPEEDELDPDAYFMGYPNVPSPEQRQQERQTQFRRSQDQLRKMQEESSKAPAWRSLPGGYGTAKQPSLQELMQLMQVMR